MTSSRYEVSLTREAEKDLKRLRPHTGHVTRIILKLEDDPFLGHTLAGNLKGMRSLEFSLPGGAYRAVYRVVDETRECLVFIVGPHENIYDKAERRLRALRRAGQM